MAKVPPKNRDEMKRWDRARAELDSYTFQPVLLPREGDGTGLLRAMVVTKRDDTTVSYVVTQEAKCSCPDHQQRNLRCKHYWMCSLHVTAQRAAAAQAEAEAAAQAEAETQAQAEVLAQAEVQVEAGEVTPPSANPEAEVPAGVSVESEEETPPSLPDEQCQMNALHRLFVQARVSGLKFPKLWFNYFGSEIVFHLAGERSMRPGTLSVTDGGPYSARQYYGRVEIDGTWAPTPRCPAEITRIVEHITADPSAAIARYGKATGACACCNRLLTDPRSTEAGYGPVCAEHWGLPWG